MIQRFALRPLGQVLLPLAAGCVCLLPTGSEASAADFRIETDVTQADHPKPLQQSVTIFRNGVAYDFSRDQAHRVTVVDPANNGIIFLDSEKEIQARINLQQLHEFMQQARKELAASSMAAILEDANLVEVDSAANTITVGQQHCRYEAKLQQPEQAGMAELYAAFADASACINAWKSPDRHPPAFPRLRLNQSIREQQAIPYEITRTTTPFSGGQQQVLSSRIHANWQLSAQDIQRADQFDAMMLSYPSVDVSRW